MKKILNFTAAVVAVALLSTTSMAQMGRKSGGSSAPRQTYSAPKQSSYPRQTYSPTKQYSAPRQTTSTGMGMGASGKMNGSLPSNNTTTIGSGMGASGKMNSQPKIGSSTTTSTSTYNKTPSTYNYNATKGPQVGGTTKTTTHVYSIGSIPKVHYSRTIVVGGRTQYVYPDGSWSWSATGAIAGYLATQNAINTQNAYNQGMMDAQAQQNYNNTQNAYNQGVAQAQANAVAQQNAYNQGLATGTPGRGVGAGTVVFIVLVVIAAVIGVGYLLTRNRI